MVRADRFHVPAMKGFIMRLLPCLLLSALLSAIPVAQVAAEPADLTGTPNGSLHLFSEGREVCSFTPFGADGAWKFSAPAEVPVAANAPFRFTLKIGRDTVPGEVRVTERDGTAEAEWTFTPANAVAVNALAISSDFTVPTLAGGTWDADDKHGVFPLVFGGSGLFGKEVRALALTFPDKRRVNFAFPRPTFVGLQDNRQWGGQSFVMRIGKGIGTLAANERSIVAMTITVPDGLHYRRDLPVAMAANSEWIPLKTELDVEPGSALDLSGCGFTDGPCGAKGRVIATPEGHFAYASDPKTARRFYGVNLCFSAVFLPKEQVDRLLDRLVRLGYNTVRIHHYENGFTKPIWKPGFDWDPEHVDQFDYMIAGCAKRGLWVTTDLFVSRPVPGKQIGLTGDYPDANRFKLLVPVYEPAYQDWATFTRKLLDHVNPYTGKRLADEPALAWISLINEDSGYDGKMPQWIAAWNRWLAAHYANRDDLDAALGDLVDSEDPAAGTVAFPENIRNGRRGRVCQVFLADTEQAMVERMRHLLRDELKCQALITDRNCGPNFAPLQAMRNSAFDYVDDHFYIDHPVFLAEQWHLPSSCPNTNPVREGAPGGLSSASLRIWGKPLTVSEFDYAGPGRFRGVGGILTGALAAFQDWDAIWRFAYAHKDKDLFTPAPMDYFNLVNDPLNQAADRAAVLLYLRRDLKTAPNRLAVVMPRAQLRNPPGRLASTGVEAFAWVTRIGDAVVDDATQAPRDAVSVPLLSAGDRDAVASLLREHRLPADQSDGLIHSETGEVTIDRKLGVLTIDTPRTAGGYADPKQSIAATKAGVRVDGFTVGATVFVSSLEASPIRTAKRLLVTHLTDLQNTGARYGESARQTLLAWGTLPHLVCDGAATVHIALAEPAAYQVWSLSTGGHRLERVPATTDGQGLSFVLRVKGADGARMLYEVTR